MRRLLIILIVGLLCATTSGVLELMVSEQCAFENTTSPVDGSCPPTCLRCHCARPFDVVVPVRLTEVLLERAQWTEPVQSVAAASPRDVLHVPRPAAV